MKCDKCGTYRDYTHWCHLCGKNLCMECKEITWQGNTGVYRCKGGCAKDVQHGDTD